jgi:hypothetical protein
VAKIKPALKPGQLWRDRTGKWLVKSVSSTEFVWIYLHSPGRIHNGNHSWYSFADDVFISDSITLIEKIIYDLPLNE